jgi:thioester reductase-like protein
VLEGDAAAIDLGLSGAEFRDLAATVTRIHHAAHVSYLGADPDDAAYANVQGAAEIVELGRACDRLERIVHHSTAQVSGDRTGVVLEHELDVGQSFRNPVLATRMTAERVMRRAMPELPIAVVRPTLLVGDSITGETQRLDGPYVLVAMVLGMPGDMPFPLPRDVDNPLDIVPVDYVAKAAHAIGRHRDASGKTFHLTSSEQLNARDVLDLIAQAGGRRTRKSFISANLASAFLRTPGLAKLMREPRALLEQLSCGARYDAANTRALLGAELSCPPLSSYVDTWVTAVQQQWTQTEPDTEA